MYTDRFYVQQEIVFVNVNACFLWLYVRLNKDVYNVYLNDVFECTLYNILYIYEPVDSFINVKLLSTYETFVFYKKYCI